MERDQKRKMNQFCVYTGSNQKQRSTRQQHPVTVFFLFFFSLLANCLLNDGHTLLAIHCDADASKWKRQNKKKTGSKLDSILLRWSLSSVYSSLLNSSAFAFSELVEGNSIP